MHAASFQNDPKHLGFVLARYSFVARMLQGKQHVLEIGCGDGTGAHVVKKVVGRLYGLDREEQPTFPGAFYKFDIIRESDGRFCALDWSDMDAVYALDVLEHIDPGYEHIAIQAMIYFLKQSGPLIIGMPSRESQPYASELSKRYHVNCKTEDELRATLSKHFHNVFLFGMNDGTLHTGFGPMAHYRLAICTGLK
jgi:SAM-dependent methyltransferase